MPAVDRIVTLSESASTGSGRRETVAPANFLDWRRDLAGTIDHLSAMEWWDVNLVGRDEPERALGFRVSSGFFPAMGVEPIIGRGFRADEETRGSDLVVVLGDGLWKRRFAADPAIVGRSFDEASAQLVVEAARLARDFPEDNKDRRRWGGASAPP
jgi:hypothetical protein